MSAWVCIGRFSFRYRGYLLPVAVLLLFIPSPPLFSDPRVSGIVGLATALVGQILRVTTIGLAYIIRGGRNHQVYAEELITQGLYAHCRNPMYLANFFLTLGVGFTSNSVAFCTAGLVISAFMHVSIVAAEEEYLSNRFGAAYERYRASVPRWSLRLTGLLSTLRGMRFDWHRIVVKEYSSLFDWLSAAALLAIINIVRYDHLSESGWLAGVAGLLILYRVLLSIVAARISRLDSKRSADAHGT